MESIAIFIPKEYLVPDMSPHKKKVFELANAILENLRKPPNYKYIADGSKLYRYTTATTVHSSVLQIHLMADTDIFTDAITQLVRDEHISIVDEVIKLEPQGRLHIVDNGYEYGQNDPVPEFEYVLKDGLLIPKQKEEPKAIAYKPQMSKKQRTTLARYLKANNLVNDPTKFVAFLNGENDGEGIEVLDKNDNLAAVTILLKELRSKNLIQLNFGNEFREFFASKIRPFSVLQGKEQIEAFLKNQRKHKNKTWRESDAAKNLIALLETLTVSGITVFVFPL